MESEFKCTGPTSALYIGLTSPWESLGVVPLTKWEMNSSHAVLLPCICSGSSPRPHLLCCLKVFKNKRLHSPGYSWVKTRKDKGKGNEKMEGVYSIVSLLPSLDGCCLYSYGVKSTRGYETSSAVRQIISSASCFPPSSHPSVSPFPHQWSRLLCCGEMLPKTEQQRRERKW